MSRMQLFYSECDENAGRNAGLGVCLWRARMLGLMGIFWWPENQLKALGNLAGKKVADCFVSLNASHRHGLHMTHGGLLEEHLNGILVVQESVGLVDGSDIRGVELNRGSGGLRGSVDSRGGLVLLGRGGSVDLEESHVCSCGWVGWVGLGESVCTSA